MIAESVLENRLYSLILMATLPARLMLPVTLSREALLNAQLLGVAAVPMPQAVIGANRLALTTPVIGASRVEPAPPAVTADPEPWSDGEKPTARVPVAVWVKLPVSLTLIPRITSGPAVSGVEVKMTPG